MPVYNGALFVAQAIDSVLCQTLRDLELIIVDDGSDDDTPTIISSYRDARVKLVRNGKNLGIVKSRNAGFAAATGQYIALLDSDDVALPTRLSEQVGFLEANPCFGMVGSWIEIIDDKGTATGEIVRYTDAPEEIPIRLLFNNCFAQSAVMVRADILPAVPYRQMAPAEDYDLWVQLCAKAKAWNLQKVLVKYRVHGSNISLLKLEEQENFVAEVIREYLAKLSVVPSEREMKVHRRIATMQFEPSLAALCEFEAWLLKLLAANNKGCYFEAAAFQRALSALWHYACRHSTGLGLAAWNAHRASALCGLSKISTTQKIRFLTLCVLKRRRLPFASRGR